MFGWNPEDTSNWLLLLVIYGGVVLAAFWLAMVIWTYRDMRARSRDRLAQLLVAVMVAILTFPGLLIYLLLRPRETISEAYERSLEEEALLQEIEEKPTCPGCSQRIQSNWQVCPNCHTKLKKPCLACGKTLELAWNICPYCATPTPQAAVTADFGVLNDFNTVITSPPPRAVRRRNSGDSQARASAQSSSSSGGSLEFIDGEDY
jgi:RNA polymerase subunit RPABC4/transcription elongation factor Spt4